MQEIPYTRGMWPGEGKRYVIAFVDPKREVKDPRDAMHFHLLEPVFNFGFVLYPKGEEQKLEMYLMMGCCPDKTPRDQLEAWIGEVLSAGHKVKVLSLEKGEEPRLDDFLDLAA